MKHAASTQGALDVPPGSPPGQSPGFPPADRVLRQQDVVERVGLSIDTIYRRIKTSTFPKPVRLGPGSVGWRESAINEWIAALPDVDLVMEEGPAGCPKGRGVEVGGRKGVKLKLYANEIGV